MQAFYKENNKDISIGNMDYCLEYKNDNVIFSLISSRKNTCLSFSKECVSESEAIYHINRHVLYYLSPNGLSKFGVINNPNKVVKKRMPNTIICLLKHYKKNGDLNIFADSNLKYIIIYKVLEAFYENMETNLLYFGYTLKEINSMTVDEIIDELLSR